MADASFEQVGEGRFRIRGELTFATVTAVLAESRPMFRGAADELELDLGDVSRADSAGIALLVAWLREARAANKTIHFHRVPPQMHAIAQVSDLEEILPM